MDGGIAAQIDIGLPPPPPRVTRRRSRLWLVMVLAPAVGLFCWRYVMPRQVEAVQVEPAPFQVTVSGPGLLDALQKVEVSARVQGRIAALPIEQNDVLTAGALIARLDAPDVVQQVAETQANAEAARLHVKETENDQLSARAAFVHAQLDFDRKAALLRTSDATRADHDAARATLDQATANLARDQASVQHARVAANSAAAASRAMEAQLQEYTISAPISGVVTQRNHSLGDIVTPGSSIAELADPRSIIVSTRLDELVMSQLAPGQPVELRLTSFPGRVFQGRVLRLGRSVDTTTREFTVDVTPAELPPHWAIGQRALVTITTETIPHAIAVPQSALAPRAGQPGVWIAGYDHRAHWQQIRTGAVCGNLIQVSDGITAGQTVLVHPAGIYAWAPMRWSANASAQP